MATAVTHIVRFSIAAQLVLVFLHASALEGFGQTSVTPDSPATSGEIQLAPDGTRDDIYIAERKPDRNLPIEFDGVGVDERLGESVPGQLVFRDENDHEVTIESFLGKGHPVILNFAYHNCPMLCSILLESLAGTIDELQLDIGTDYEVVTVSFSAIETYDLAARQKARYLERINRDGGDEGWHFLTGTEENIQALAQATGFRFQWIESTREFAHPAALIFLSGEGVITRYLHGMAFQEPDVRRAIVEASRGEIGTTLDRIFMYCYRYDPSANSYVIHAENLMKISGILTLAVLLLGLVLLWRRERDRHQDRGTVLPINRSSITGNVATELLNQNRPNG